MIAFFNNFLFLLLIISFTCFVSHKKNFLSNIIECFNISEYQQTIYLLDKLLSVEISIITNSGW